MGHLFSQNELQSPHLVSWNVSMWYHKCDWLMNFPEHSLQCTECSTSSCSRILSFTDRNPTRLKPSLQSRQFLTLSITCLALDTGNSDFIRPNSSDSELLLILVWWWWIINPLTDDKISVTSSPIIRAYSLTSVTQISIRLSFPDANSYFKMIRYSCSEPYNRFQLWNPCLGFITKVVFLTWNCF